MTNPCYLIIDELVKSHVRFLFVYLDRQERNDQSDYGYL